MASKTDFTNVGLIKDEEMENIELHRSTSRTSGHIEILEKLKTEKSDHEKKSITMLRTYTYVTSKTRLFLSEIKNMKIEVILFLYTFSYILRNITTTTMIMEKVCVVHLQQSQEVCAKLSENHEVKVIVEKIANNYHLGHSLIQLIPSAFLCLFIGSWSDTYSRKIPLMGALIGIISDGFGTLICAHFLHTRVEYIFIPAIFSGISGGFICTLMILYAYVSDVSTSSSRTMKYALVEIAFLISMPLGSLVGGWIFKYYGYVPVFLTSTCGHIVGLFWVIFILEETRGLDVTDNWMVKLRALWSLNSVVSSYKATIKKRPNKGREQIWLLIIGMSLAIFTFTSTGGIIFLYVHHLYDWDNTTYSTVSAIFSLISMVLTLILVPLSKKFRIDDPYLGIAGTVSLIMKDICIGLAMKKEIFYLAQLLGLLSGFCTLAARSRISKAASKEDLGKVFAILTMAESLMPIISAAVGSQVFNASLEILPGLIFIVMGILMLIPLAVYIWIASLPKVDYDMMNNSSEDTSRNVDENATQVPAEKLREKH